jgi:DNA-binding CsgD family transcriptional regulator
VASKNVATLLERDRELAELRNALRDAQDDRGQLVLIEAPAGLGKTSLLWATFDTAAGVGFASSRTRASELERDFPYGCMRRLLEPMIVRAPGADRDRLFEEAAALAIPLFEPGTPVASVVSGDGAFARLHGLYWLLNNLARERPVALCIDDLQWSDAESLRFLSYLASRLDGLAVAVLATVRARENVTPDLARLSAQPEVRVLRPEPLSVEAAATLCELQLGTKVAPDFAMACHGATGGNPFFLQTLLREAKELRFLTDAREVAHVRRIGPAAVARAVLLRLSAAPAAATALVRAIAVLGEATSVVDAARLADLLEDEAARVADVLVELGILKAADELQFAHPIVRHAIYEAIGVHERARAHARAARILAERGADDERIAAQIVKSEPIGDAGRVELLRRVAARAFAQGAPAAALVWLKRASAEPPPLVSRAEVLFEMGSAELRLGMPDAVVHLQEAVATLRDPGQLAVAAQQLANAMSMIGNADGAVAALASAITIIEPQDRERALILEAELAAKSQQAHHEGRAIAAARLARYQNVRGQTAGERLVLASLAFEHARASESESEAVKHVERGLAGGGLFRQQPDVVGPFYALVRSLLATDALELARTSIEQALADARLRGSIPAMAFLTTHRGYFFFRSGDLAFAEADARTALDLMTTHDIRLGARFALALLIECLIEAGQLAAAEETLRSSALGSEIPPGLANNNLLETRGRLRIAQGNARVGLDDLIEFGRRDQLWGAANPVASRWRSTACLALRAAGDEAGALKMVAEEVARARRWGAASGIGIALRAAALIENSASLELLTEAVGVLERSPAKLEHARALTDLGAAQRRANRRADARKTLEQALKIARLCGTGALAERADVELRAAGGRSSDPSRSRLEQLTVSERRVAELAAKGHSNPQIAQTLFVTRKTIETHLGHIYSKLEISGRAELARALAQEP